MRGHGNDHVRPDLHLGIQKPPDCRVEPGKVPLRKLL
jgi:hypothetical protein